MGERRRRAQERNNHDSVMMQQIRNTERKMGKIEKKAR